MDALALIDERSPSRPCVVFDMDDTLVYTEYKYNRGMLRALDLLQDALMPERLDLQQTLALQAEKQIACLQRLGLHNCFVQGWVDAANAMFDRAGRPDDANRQFLIQRMTTAIKAELDGPYYVVDGALALLDWLRTQDVDLVMVTAGNDDFQLQKARQSGLAPYFTDPRDGKLRIYVVKSDKTAHLAACAYKSQQRAVMVGNSLRSDIAPAVQAGVLALYVPARTWAYNQVVLDPSTYAELPNLAAVRGFLETWLESLAEKRRAGLVASVTVVQ